MPALISRFYMNAPLFALRTFVALLIWSLLAWMPGLRNTLARAAIGLLVMSILTNILPVDWVVSTQPGFYSSAFGFGFGIEQILAALALCAIIGPQGANRGECRDLAGLLIATLLGVIYFIYMQFAIIWYGNIPQSAAWYVVRGVFPWPEIGALAFALGAVLPFFAMLNTRVRESELALRLIGLSMCGGIALHVIWLVVPSFGIATLGPALLAMALVTTLFAVWLRSSGIRWTHPARAMFGVSADHG